MTFPRKRDFSGDDWRTFAFSTLTQGVSKASCNVITVNIGYCECNKYHKQNPWARRASIPAGSQSQSFLTPEDISQLQAWKVESEPILLVMNCKVSFCWRRQWRSVSCPKCGRKQKPEYFRGPTDRGQWIECMQYRACRLYLYRPSRLLWQWILW